MERRSGTRGLGARRPWPAITVGLVVAATGWMLDQATKALAVRALTGGHTMDVPGPLYLSLSYNEGAALGAPVPWWVFPIVTVVVAVFSLRGMARAAGTAEPLAYGLLIGGALGNLTDRMLRTDPSTIGRGGVADWIGVGWFPTFNLADVWLTVGVLVLLIAGLRREAPAVSRG